MEQVKELSEVPQKFVKEGTMVSSRRLGAAGAPLTAQRAPPRSLSPLASDADRSIS